MRRLIVAGLALRGDGYPNAERTLAALAEDGWQVEDCAHWWPPDMHLWRVARGPIVRRAGWALWVACAGMFQAVRILIYPKRGAWVYVPYPAPILLWWLSFVPRKLRPRCIADAYISIWDSMFRDRSEGQSESRASRLVRGFEARALRAAALVFVDTAANARQIAADFSIPPERIRSLPLAIDEARFLPILPHAMRPGCIRVLFIGTMIPLHGIDTILDAFAMLVDDERFDLRLIGSGQEAGKVEAFLAARPVQGRVTWVRDWLTMEQMTSELALADICLGVFGGAGKAARVLPYKIYMYMAAGKVVITQPLHSLPEGSPVLPIAYANSALALVEKVRALADDDQVMLEMAAASRAYYENWLSNARVVSVWREALVQL